MSLPLPANLSDLDSFASAEEKALLQVVLEAGQAHLLEGWAVGADESKKHAFFAQVAILEKNYPGGIRAYAVNARKLLQMSAAGETALGGYSPEVRGAQGRAARAPPESSPPSSPPPLPPCPPPCARCWTTSS